ncbi:hypothetical protein [Streptomyces sp. NPDC057910]|uniref:hypothetical protein n=1 Tax=Streptomyces sp. NPDC057910 TaxID=3346278 RepID=UPI0036EA4409
MTEPTSSTGPAGLGPGEGEAWNILALALQDADGGPELLLQIHQGLEVSPGLELPRELCEKIADLLPLEDQTRLASTASQLRQIVGNFAPGALESDAHSTVGFVRTLYAQRELDAALSSQELRFTPERGSDLTISHAPSGAELHGPGTLTAITGGKITTRGQASVITVSGGTVHACDQSTVTDVIRGFVTAQGQALITTVAGGQVHTYGQSTIAAVTGGRVRAYDQSTVTEMSGGTVDADGHASILTVTGGDATERHGLRAGCDRRCERRSRHGHRRRRRHCCGR